MADKIQNESDANKQMLVTCCIILALIAVLTAVVICRHFYSPNQLESDTTDTSETVFEDTTVPEETTAEETTAPEETTPEDTTRAPITDTENKTDFTPPSNGKYTYVSLENEKLKYPGTVIQAGHDAGKDYLNNLVYIGDSLTYGLEFYKVLPEENVWVPSNGTMTLSDVANKKIYFTEAKKEIPIKEALERTKPQVLVIALGVNGISWLKEESFKNEFRNLVSAVRKITPETKIILQSILPVTPNYKYQESINNFKISRANLWMLEVAYELGLYYMDVAECLVDETGYLPDSYDSGDGLHLNASTYKIVENYIRTEAVTTAPQPELPADTEAETSADTTAEVTEATTSSAAEGSEADTIE